MPILFCVSDTDTVTPPEQTLRYARTAPHGEIKTLRRRPLRLLPRRAVRSTGRDQIEFLTRHLQVADRDVMEFAPDSLPDRRAALRSRRAARSPTGPVAHQRQLLDRVRAAARTSRASASAPATSSRSS